ncbi:MAG: hypothetical protein ACTSV6_01555, partial [Candidatus Heimdallarchaeota archaeon]
FKDEEALELGETRRSQVQILPAPLQTNFKKDKKVMSMGKKMKLRSIVASIKIAWVLLILAGIVITTFAVTTMTTMNPAGNQASGIELRLSSVDPPDPEPPCIIYRDIVGVPETTYLGLTVRIFNWKDTTLYFSITGSGEGYTFKTVQLGTVGSGKNKYFLLDAFATRPRPTPEELEEGEKIETIELILSAYSDENYTDLVETYAKQVTVHWINSEDPAWTVDVLNNFDDGTVQGWAVANEANNEPGYPILEVVSDYVLSAPYSIRMNQLDNWLVADGDAIRVRAKLYKSFTTPNKDKVFAVFNIRVSGYVDRGRPTIAHKNLRFKRDEITLIFLGHPYIEDPTSFIPKNKWMRIVVPLPKNTTLELRIVHEWCDYSNYGYSTGGAYLWLDNFKIISKEA